MIREGLDTMKGSRREGLVEGLEVVWLAEASTKADKAEEAE